MRLVVVNNVDSSCVRRGSKLFPKRTVDSAVGEEPGTRVVCICRVSEIYEIYDGGSPQPSTQKRRPQKGKQKHHHGQGTPERGSTQLSAAFLHTAHHPLFQSLDDDKRRGGDVATTRRAHHVLLVAATGRMLLAAPSPLCRRLCTAGGSASPGYKTVEGGCVVLTAVPALIPNGGYMLLAEEGAFTLGKQDNGSLWMMGTREALSAQLNDDGGTLICRANAIALP